MASGFWLPGFTGAHPRCSSPPCTGWLVPPRCAALVTGLLWVPYLHTLSCVFSVCSSPPEWYFCSGTPRPCRTCLGMWWLKNLCRIRKGVRPTQIKLEGCVGLKEANTMKPTHSSTAESGPCFWGGGNQLVQPWGHVLCNMDNQWTRIWEWTGELSLLAV